ncbi:Ran-binding-domain-containing protein [Xylariomycetidae sp. FL2044]|nr:Ran-binding-domain-containing protein [Xylariomycetidae sp. FL2044]
MDAFISKLSSHAASYAIRSCIALTSTYVIQQSSRLLKSVEHDPLRGELSHLQRRLARKIELISPILESIEFRYSRGNSALQAVVRTAQELRQDIDSLAKRIELATLDQLPENGARHAGATAARHAELVAIIADIKELITSIDDCIPLVNLWVSAIGGIQDRPSSFSPSRLLQASMLVNVGDSQFILDPTQPMQIGPDFTLSLYMLFRGHASHQADEPYGLDEGQRKPMWQEAIHKARVRLFRVPLDAVSSQEDHVGSGSARAGYAYQVQIVEDLDDGRVHTFDEGDPQPSSYNGIALAGIREFVPVRQIAKMFYADVGRILNINNEEGASSNPVLLLKRDVSAPSLGSAQFHEETGGHARVIDTIETEDSLLSDDTLSEGNSQDDIDRQIREESEVTEGPEPHGSSAQVVQQTLGEPNMNRWTLPQDLDPEWIALEVFDMSEDDTESTDEEEDEEPTPEDEDIDSSQSRRRRLRQISRASVDSNLVTQLNRMSLASTSSRPSSQDSDRHHPHSLQHPTVNHQHGHPPRTPTPSRETTLRSSGAIGPLDPLSPNSLLARSPFGAIKTSLSLLEMLLRLTSLQEFEQTTHLAIPDHVLKFYLDDSASSTTGLHGRDRLVQRADAERRVGFDPYSDSPVRGGGLGG